MIHKPLSFYQYFILFYIVDLSWSLLGFNPHLLPLHSNLVSVPFVAFTLFSHPKLILNKSVFLLAIFFLIVFMGQAMGHSFYPEGTYSMLFKCIYMFGVFALSNAILYYGKLNDMRFLKLVIVVSIAAIMLGAIATFLLQYFSITQLRDSDTGIGSESVVKYNVWGIMSYGLAQSWCILIPMLVCLAKFSSKKIAIVLAFCVCFLLLVQFQSIITTSFFLGLTFGLFVLVFSFKNKVRLFFSVLLLIVLVIIARPIANNFLLFLSLQTNSSLMENKLSDINDIIKGEVSERNQIDGRHEQQQISQKTFLENPFSGSWDRTKMGGHSFFTDYLAFYGIPVFSLFLLSLFFTLRSFYMIMELRIKLYFLVAICPYLFISYLKGDPAYETYLVMLVIVPAIALYISAKLKGKNIPMINAKRKRASLY